MSEQPPSVAIILINWNQFDDVAECVLSLNKLKYPNYKVFIVDNNSSDESFRKLQEKFTYVRFIRRKENEGFTGGMNAGMRMAIESKFNYVLILNSDTVVSSRLLCNLVSAYQSDKNIAIAGPVIFDYWNPMKLDFAGSKVNLKIGSVKHIRKMKKVDACYDIGFMTGSCMLISVDILQEHGVFDDSYFAYCEDLDLSLRLKRAGYRIVCDPKSIIWHKISAKIVKEIRYYFWFRNMLLIVKKYTKLPFLPIAVTKILIRNALKCLVFSAASNKSKEIMVILWALSDFSKKRFGKGRLDEVIALVNDDSV